MAARSKSRDGVIVRRREDDRRHVVGADLSYDLEVQSCRASGCREQMSGPARGSAVLVASPFVGSPTISTLVS